MSAILTSGRKSKEINLRDRLSRLNFRDACKLLGPDGEKLINRGGRFEFDLAEDAYLGGDLFRLRVGHCVATITLQAEAPDRLRWNCTHCDAACEHVGAAFSLALEEKLALGLATPPPERKPIESLSEGDLVRTALAERSERARDEKMSIKSTAPDVLWTDYLVTNSLSGRTYRVALRGWEPGDSFCSCPDFRKNTLGTCKHVIAVQRRMKPRFSEAERRRPFEPRDIAVHLRYGEATELRLIAPQKLDAAAAEIVAPIRGRAIDDVDDLIRRVEKLTALGGDVTIYPDAEEHINRVLFQERIATLTREVRRIPRTHPLRKELLKTELLPYQIDGIAFAAGAGRAVLADEMGLGKTIQGIGVAELLAREAEVKRVLIVCPASLKSQWRSEIARFCDRDCQLVQGGAAGRAQQYANNCFYTICNYEQVLRDILPIEKSRWDLIILDEAQRIKNWESQTSRVIKALRSPFALVLTGTPLENRLDDLFSVVEFIDDRRLGPAFRFFNRHRVVDEKGKLLGVKNLADLRERLRPVLLRRTRAEVLSQLPSRSTEIVRIPPTEEQFFMHQGHKRIVSSIVGKKYISEMDLLRLRKALLMCRMAADSSFLVDKQLPAYSSKLERLAELLDELLAEKDRKILLFSEWTTMLDLIEPLLKRRAARFVRLDGSVPQKQRAGLVHAFQTDPAVRLFLTSNAGSTGLNLQAADTVINVDLPWNPAVLEQRIARAHRMGQKRPVQVYVLVTERTIEEGLLATLAAKRDLALAALDASSDVDQIDLASGTEELKRRLEVLIGAPPPAPIDESQRAHETAEVERLTRRDKVAVAGGQLLTAAFAMLGELLPAPPTAAESVRQTTELLKQRLGECLEPDGQGGMRLTVALPNAAALDGLAQSLTRLMAAQ